MSNDGLPEKIDRHTLKGLASSTVRLLPVGIRQAVLKYQEQPQRTASHTSNQTKSSCIVT